MFTTNKDLLKNLTTENRIWQGIPSIAVTKGGRQFVAFYSGGIKEDIGNYVVLCIGTDNTEFSEPIAAAVPDDSHRMFDCSLWIDPQDRLWMFWARFPDDAVYAVVCDDPDAEKLKFSEEFYVGKDVMMNKPIVLSSGEWMLPIAVWAKDVTVLPRKNINEEEIGAGAYISTDNGKTFEKRGKAIIPDTSYDEHMFLELKDGTIEAFVRTKTGLGISFSKDKGYTWSKGEVSEIKGPSSRFHICRLPSGRVLMINHHEFTYRNNLTALLSEDDGKTWTKTLLLDERNEVSYPDVSLHNGFIYITYDRERGALKKSLNEAYECAREILTAKITEEDIIAGKLVNKDSYLKRVISKLGEYKGKDENPYNEQ